mmetsp:Transcript_39535/g.57729  ORF Transcript_39535/g.57729 Transcript_39535/m.57729 type:complete len:663 (-) Transcript_39535:211-2199(-)
MLRKKATNDEGNMAGHPSSQLRGYFPQSSDEQRMGTDSSGIFTPNLKKHLACRDDPVHGVWRTVICAMTGLLRSCRVKSQNLNMYNIVTSEPLHRQCLSLVADFLCTYDSVVFSCINACAIKRDMAVTNSTSHDILGLAMPKTALQNMPSSSVTFTLNNLGEAGDILALVSEMFTGSNRKQFESTCPVLYKKLLDSSLEITQSLTSFLGAVGTARELFAALSTLNKAIEEETNASNANTNINRPLASVDATFDLHPLLAEEGIPAARHEAIRNAHFASSCCITMTREDFASSLVAFDSSTSKKQDIVQQKNSREAPKSPLESNNTDGKGPSSSLSLEKSFQMHVNNRFIMAVEQIAAKCLFHSFSIITKFHPASTNFVSFTVEEAERLDVTSFVQEGMIIALRPLGFSGRHDPFVAIDVDESSSSPKPSIRFAKVLQIDVFQRTWDVEYIDAPSNNDGSTIERNILGSRLAGMEDLTKRRCVLEYAPAPKSVMDDLGKISGRASVGHLLLALRWCHQHAILPSKGTNVEEQEVPIDIIQCVAERAGMLLGTEISLHRELGSKKSVGEDIAKKINEQILELFDDDDAMPEKRGLKLLTDTEIWTAVRAQLKVELEMAKIEQENMRRAWEQNAGVAASTSSWGGGMRRGGKRSPFRVFGRKSSF